MKTRKTKHISRRLRRFPRANKAVSALEYAILAGAVAIATGTAIAVFTDDMSNAINNLGNMLPGNT